MAKARVAEGRLGTWAYHLTTDPKSLKAICGKPTMPCKLPRKAWGVTTHLREHYCETCHRLAEERGI